MNKKQKIEEDDLGNAPSMPQADDVRAINLLFATKGAEAAERARKIKLGEGDLDKAEGQIASIDYHRFPNTTVTVCCMVTREGLAFTGMSACVDPADFDYDLGKSIARSNALREMALYLAVINQL